MNFIWDLDGTLLDSYGVINKALLGVLKLHGLEGEEPYARSEIITGSVHGYLGALARANGLSAEALEAEFAALHEGLTDEIRVMPGAKRTLHALARAGARQFVATHRGKSAHRALENAGISALFDEIVTSEAGFKRKPAPDCVNYLIKKYALARESTYYVGDRRLDMECGRSAGVGTILFYPSSSPAALKAEADITVKALEEIALRFGGGI